MKKGIIVSILIIGICLTASAKTYVLRDKLTGEVKGTASISDKYINDWAEDYILMDEGEEYRGKKYYEMVYENGELRFATQQEIDDYFDSLKPPTEKEKLLTLLADEDIKDEIKKIKGDPVTEPIMMGNKKSIIQRVKDFLLNK